MRDLWARLKWLRRLMVYLLANFLRLASRRWCCIVWSCILAADEIGMFPPCCEGVPSLFVDLGDQSLFYRDKMFGRSPRVFLLLLSTIPREKVDLASLRPVT